MPSQNTQEVRVGLGTIVGYSSAAAAAIAPLVGELADAAEPLGIPPVVWIIISAVLAVMTNLGRMYQAGQKAAQAVKLVDPPILDFDAPDIGDADPVDTVGNAITHHRPPDDEATRPPVEG